MQKLKQSGKLNVQILWTKLATNDLLLIEDYINTDNPAAAISTVLSIINNIEKYLLEYPNIGRKGRVIGTREFVITGTPYIAIYRLHNNQLQILRILHTSQKWETK